MRSRLEQALFDKQVARYLQRWRVERFPLGAGYTFDSLFARWNVEGCTSGGTSEASSVEQPVEGEGGCCCRDR